MNIERSELYRLGYSLSLSLNRLDQHRFNLNCVIIVSSSVLLLLVVVVEVVVVEKAEERVVKVWTGPVLWKF